jgi:hypothetical protein
MILGLLIDVTPICGLVSSTGWRDSVGEAIGIRPPPPRRPRGSEGQEGDVCALRVAHNSLRHLPGVLRTQSFRGMSGLVFGIWMMSDNLLT